MFWQLTGAAAACLTMLAFVPQIVKALKTKSVKDVSVMTLLQLAVGVSLWIVYGIYRRDPILIMANVITLASVLILVYLYFKLRKEK